MIVSTAQYGFGQVPCGERMPYGRAAQYVAATCCTATDRQVLLTTATRANPKQPFSRLDTVSWFSILGRQARRMLLTALLGGLLGATLVRLGPGFGVDERELDMSLSSESVAAVRQERAAERNIPSFYWHYLRGLLRGDFGVSHSLNRPVSELLAERLPYTL